jgi:hypothetical protein
MASALTALLWVVAISLVAMVPYPRHRPYAGALLLVLPAVLGWLAWEHGALPVLALLLAVASILRKPLGFLLRWIGRRTGLFR